MAALSDYLESGLLSHIFRNAAFPRPSSIAIALTSGVPLDSDTGQTIPELPSGVLNGNIWTSTNYKRIPLGPPAASGDNTWQSIGINANGSYSVSGRRHDNTPGYFYPLYLTASAANDASAIAANVVNGNSTVFYFSDFPNIPFFAPSGGNLFQSGVPTKSSYPDYEGNGFIRNKNQIVFNTALTEWGWISGIAIVDHDTVGSGNLLMYSKLTNPRYVFLGDNIRFDINSLEISLK
jgi:hypothetical protein